MVRWNSLIPLFRWWWPVCRLNDALGFNFASNAKLYRSASGRLKYTAQGFVQMDSQASSILRHRSENFALTGNKLIVLKFHFLIGF